MAREAALSTGTILLLVGAGSLLAGLGFGWALARRQPSAEGATGDTGDGTEPLLGWVLRASGARGLWLVTGEGADAVQRVGAGVPVPVDEMITARVTALARGEDREGVERLETGVLGFVARPPAAAGLLLPAGASAEEPLADLRRLLQQVQARPTLERVARQQERPDESVESMAVRLAHQVERLFDADVAVALCRPRGVEVLGASLRSDQRLLHTRAAAGSAMDQVARGEADGPTVTYDPLGVILGDRRQRERRSVVYPLQAYGQTIGSLALWPADGLEPAGHRLAELLQALDHAGPRLAGGLDALEHREQATHDPLTGLRNRRGFEQATGDVAVQSAVLIATDLDKFKSLNDTLGHAAGDAALVHFSSLLATLVRGRDVAARTGGEEFAIWLPGATLERGMGVAERIRQALQDSAWHWQGRPWPLTASFGVAGWPETTKHRDNLAAQADRALYKAKESGRNKVLGA